MWMKASVDRPRESSRGIAIAGVADGKEDVGAPGPQRGSERPPESMHVVKVVSGEREHGGRVGWMVVRKWKRGRVI